MIDESPGLTPERVELAAEYGRKAELARQRGAVTEQQLPEPVHPEPVIGEKVTSPELASIASQYVRMSDETQATIAAGINGKGLEIASAQRFFADVRRLAASVLSQAEGQTRG